MMPLNSPACARLEPQVLGRQKMVVISNEVRGEILYNLQLKLCFTYKISISYNAHAHLCSIEMTISYKILLFPTPVVASERKIGKITDYGL
ncbi:MAG: hypothetical protein JWR38_4449 [Mucilaginibacter sp.]|nr:hypothetical protein [Mucilaginibacter sp.]